MRSSLAVNDLFADVPTDPDTQVKVDIKRTQRDFEARFWQAHRVGRNQANRKKHYTQLRREIGDDAAREVAKFVEAIYAGNARYPKWFERLR
jgi:hypothetical protein